MRVEDLVARIRDAFADVSCPTQLTSGPSGSLHDPLSHFEYDVQNGPELDVSRLFPPAEDSLQERARFEARMSLPTAPQVDAVRELLRSIAKRDAEEHAFDDDELETPQRALDRYWSHA